MTADQLIRQAAIQVPEEDLRDIVRRIVEAADPEKIIVFGSAARGTMGPNSDLDLLVIKRGDYHHITVAQEIFSELEDVDYAVDVIVNTPEEVERYKGCFALALYPAMREGIVVYERAM
jgi:predicted nucleotidyltransferase